MKSYRALAGTLLTSILVALVNSTPVAAQDDKRERWQFLPLGSTGIGGQSTSSPGAAPNLATGLEGDFLFRLDHMLKAPDKDEGKLDMHLIFETGLINPARAIKTRTDPESSTALQLTGLSNAVPATNAGVSVSHERALTFGTEYSMNWTPRAALDTQSMVEIGLVIKGHVDAYFDNERFFERDGISYFRLAEPNSGSAFFRAESGFRFRLTQKPDNTRNKTAEAVEVQGNLDDMILTEVLYQRANSMGLLSDQLTANARNRFVFRFLAFPEIESAKTKNTRFTMGIEINNDVGFKGKSDIRLLYGVNIDVPSLFRN